MAFYSIKAEINALGQLTYGFVAFKNNYYTSGLGLDTFGFVWGVGDIWVPCDNETVEAVWSPCDCNSECD